MAKKIVEQLRPIFAPKSVAVIGASSATHKWGGQMVHRMLMAGYEGTIYPINPREEEVQGLPAYHSVLDVPDEIDLAAIAINAEQVPQAVRECVQKGIKGVAIISADFAETGSHGRALQEEMTKIARQGDMRIIGPNCQGIWSSTNSLNLVSPHVPAKGSLSIISQSGSLSGVFCDFTDSRGYGLSKVISVGNQADLDIADYLEFLADDPDTRAIFMYVEGFSDGRKLFKAAKETTKKKPVVVYKAAKNQAVARVAFSHTAAIAGEDRIFNAMCQQVGFIRSENLLSSLDMAATLTRQPLPKGNRMGIMGLGGQCMVLSDNCVSMGMEVPLITEEDMSFVLDGIDFPPHAPPPRNPVDFAGGTRTALIESTVLNRMAQLDYIDGIITNAPVTLARAASGSDAEIEQMATEAGELLTAIPQKFGKPLIILGFPVHMRRRGERMNKVFIEAGIPVLPSPEEAVRAMYALMKYTEIKKTAH